MAFDAYMKIDGIPGESTDDKHKDWIEIAALNHGVRQRASASASSAGGGTSERSDHRDVSVTLLCDKATPKLFEASCTGKHLKDITIELCRAGGDKQKYLEIKLEQAIVSSVDLTGQKGRFPQIQVTFNYGKIKWTYSHQRRSDGSSAGNIAAGWDLTTNKAVA